VVDRHSQTAQGNYRRYRIGKGKRREAPQDSRSAASDLTSPYLQRLASPDCCYSRDHARRHDIGTNDELVCSANRYCLTSTISSQSPN
jgi:hypothetical protein